MLEEFPYRSPRPGQAELAKFIEDNARPGKLIVVSAPTGFGKTVSVLYAVKNLVKEGVFEKALYTVRTRNELDPVIREARSLKLRFAVLYSGRRMCPMINEIIRDESALEGFWILCSLMRVQGRCRYYSRIQSMIPHLILSVILGSSNHVDVARNLAEKLGVCPYFAAINILNDVEVLALTYPYIFKERIWKAVFRDYDASRTLLIIDEAHNLLNMSSIMGESISVKELERVFQEQLQSVLSDDVKQYIRDLLKEVTKTGLTGIRGYKHVPKESINLSQGIIERLKSEASELALRSNTIAAGFLITQLASLLELALDNAYELFISRDPYTNTLLISALPTTFEPLKRVLEKFSAVIALSGTPPSQQFFERFVRVDRSVYSIDVTLFGASNYAKENSFVVVFTGASTSFRLRSSAIYETYAKLVEGLYKALTEGVILAVYPSHEVLNAIIVRIQDNMNAIIENSLPLSEVVKEVSKHNKCVLHIAAGGRLAEGIEITKSGKSLVKGVAVIGVPYPQPDDYMKMLFGKRGNSNDELGFFKEVAVIRVLQAIGRAIRSESDKALVVLADSRYVTHGILQRLGLKVKVISRSIEDVVRVAAEFWAKQRS